MSKPVKFLVIFLIFDVIVIGGYFGYKALTGKSDEQPAEDYVWVVMDDYYPPQNFLEEFIKNDAVEKGLLPLSIRNYGKNPAILRRFRGSKFVNANTTIVEITYKGIEDWALVDLKSGEQGNEIQQTVLYILFEDQWQIGDRGRLLE